MGFTQNSPIRRLLLPDNLFMNLPYERRLLTLSYLFIFDF